MMNGLEQIVLNPFIDDIDRRKILEWKSQAFVTTFFKEIRESTKIYRENQNTINMAKDFH